jgi:hypothetical protein
MKNIVEFASPDFHHPSAIFYELLLVMGAAAACWHLARRRFVEPLLIATWGHASLLAGRNIPIFALLAAPAIAQFLEELLQAAAGYDLPAWLSSARTRFLRLGAETKEMEAPSRWHLITVLVAGLVIAIIWSPNPPKEFRAEFDPKSYPAGAVAMLRKDLGARIFSHDEWGDYLIWSLYPSHRVFVDGRSDFYGDDFEEKYYIDVINVKAGWQERLDRFAVNTILLPPTLPFAGTLKESSRWRVVYDDGIAIVFQSTMKAQGNKVSAAVNGAGASRGREVTKTQASDPRITDNQSNT